MQEEACMAWIRTQKSVYLTLLHPKGQKPLGSFVQFGCDSSVEQLRKDGANEKVLCKKPFI